MSSVPHRAYIGIGSNQGRRHEHYLSALRKLALLPGTRLNICSSRYETEPWGDSEQWYINGVVAIDTRLDPQMLLRACQGIESEMGRVRTGRRWQDRVIDLDVLAYDALALRETNLMIPHPEMHRRRFVLVPLCEIAPAWVHPVLRLTAKQLLGLVRDAKIIHLVPDTKELLG